MSEFVELLLRENLTCKEWTVFSAAFNNTKPIFEAIRTLPFYPEGSKIFRAFNECLPDDIKVVILGQD